jgi:hypothetical protein
VALEWMKEKGVNDATKELDALFDANLDQDTSAAVAAFEKALAGGKALDAEARSLALALHFLRISNVGGFASISETTHADGKKEFGEAQVGRAGNTAFSMPAYQQLVKIDGWRIDIDADADQYGIDADQNPFARVSIRVSITLIQGKSEKSYRRTLGPYRLKFDEETEWRKATPWK